MWPRDVLHQPFINYLRATYDIPQLEAIEICASHMASEQERSESELPVLPVTLVQGPPGTGKTHTVKGILNCWHVVQYHRHQAAWLSRVGGSSVAGRVGMGVAAAQVVPAGQGTSGAWMGG